jgi:hypothetical protein
MQPLFHTLGAALDPSIALLGETLRAAAHPALLRWRHHRHLHRGIKK